MRLVILCEGQTEKEVLKSFLAPYCTEFSKVDIVLPGLGGAGRLKNDFRKIAETELELDIEAYVFCLIDVLNSPFTFPKNVAESDDPYKSQYAYIKTYMEGKIEPAFKDRFCCFPVIMEIETWLLADEEALNSYFNPPRKERIARPYNPESVLNPFVELNTYMHHFRKISYQKTAHGKALFERANAVRVYEDNCPHFNKLIDQLLYVQGISPVKPEPITIPNQEKYRQLVELQEKIEALYQAAEARGDLNDDDCQEIDRLEAEIERIQKI